jgi:acyl-CoA reductase-like NAD-dependent aldehyde dehydrogenase
MTTLEVRALADPGVRRSVAAPAPEEAGALVETARRAFERWRRVDVAERRRLFRRLRTRISASADRLADELRLWTGKTRVEALLNEILPTLEFLKFNERHVADVLRTRKRPTPFFFPGATSFVERHPRGVALVIGPANYPLQLSLVPLATAVIAGNVGLLKPSESAHPVGESVGRLFQDAGFPTGVVTVVPGDGSLGEALVRAGPDVVFFTGGLAAGRRVMAAAAEGPTPVILELGGQGAMVVLNDAPFERAVNGALYGAFANAGQICVSVERLYVQAGIASRFTDALRAGLSRLRVGLSDDDDYGCLPPAHTDRLAALLDDARARGATVIGGEAREGWMAPALVLNPTADAALLREEIFGPVLAVFSFDAEDDAVAAINRLSTGLNASVWTRNPARGRGLLSRLDVGNGAVNDVIKNIGNPHLPFGGIKRSGLGLTHGREGLEAFTRTLSTLVNDGRSSRELNWFPYSRRLYDQVNVYLRLAELGTSNPWAALRNLWGTLREYRRQR